MDEAIRRLQVEARRYAHGKPPTGIRYPAAFRAAVVALVRTELGRGVAFGRLAGALGLPRWSRARSCQIAWPSAPWACQASTCSPYGSTRDCSWAGRGPGGAASIAASLAGSGKGPVSNPRWAAHRW